MVLNDLDLDKLRSEFANAKPFPHVVIDGLLDEGFARQVAQAIPSYEESRGQGLEFSAVNEQRKVQITDADKFADPVRTLHEVLSSREWLEKIEFITGIPKLVADPELAGGGIHVTGPRGRLDVHVDFNTLHGDELHRRLNILVYLNEDWDEDWGGQIELWDQGVKNCELALAPKINRCLIFETSEISYHGVAPVTCPDNKARKSYAAYYYTREAPEGWDGTHHTTVFRARPDEKLRGYVLMPLERARRTAKQGVRRIAGGIKRRLLG